MRKGVLLILVSFFGLALLIAWLSIFPRRTPAWSEPLAFYQANTDPQAAILWVESGNQPQNFNPQMSVAAYSASLVFDIPSYSEPEALLQQGFSNQVAADAAPRGSSRLPYPPEMVWCALLARSDGTRTMVIIAEHVDLYNADVIVHEVAPAALPEILERIECERGLTELP